MPFFWLDGTILLIVPALILAIWAQYKVKSTYAKYSRVGTRAGLTGYDVARRILEDSGIAVDLPGGVGRRGGQSCGIERVGGDLTDHYDPRSRTLRLSEGVYHGRSVAALGVAAHEVGHAVQHAHVYAPLMLRNVMYPISSIGSSLAFPLFFLGFFLPVGLGQMVMQGAILLFAAAVLFTVVTLPVELNASRRALKALAGGGYLTSDELYGAKKVLTAAAMTYVAAAAMAVLQLLRLILLSQRRS